MNYLLRRFKQAMRVIHLFCILLKKVYLVSNRYTAYDFAKWPLNKRATANYYGAALKESTQYLFWNCSISNYFQTNLCCWLSSAVLVIHKELNQYAWRRRDRYCLKLKITVTGNITLDSYIIKAIHVQTFVSSCFIWNVQT